MRQGSTVTSTSISERHEAAWYTILAAVSIQQETLECTALMKVGTVVSRLPSVHCDAHTVDPSIVSTFNRDAISVDNLSTCHLC